MGARNRYLFHSCSGIFHEGQRPFLLLHSGFPPFTMSQPDFSPAADRNKQPILDVLRQVLPEHGSALEIASGTGQHVAWFAAGLPHWTWQPTDAQPGALNAIAARVAQQGLTNVRAPLLLDVMATSWLPDDAQAGTPVFDAIFCANMLHIAPWATCAALMRGSARHLAPGGALITYGPYLEDGVPTSDRKSTRLNSSHIQKSRMPSSA